MRTYTITDVDDDEYVKQGLAITNGEGEPGLRVGEGPAAALVPVAKEGMELFKAAKEAANANGDGVLYLNLRAADVADKGPVRLIRERGKSPYALVHVAVQAGVGGRMWLEAAGFDEELDGDAVRRSPRPFPGPGIEVVAFGHGPQGEPHGLLRITKGAAFRIRRNGALEGAPPVLDVNWNGHQLFVRPAVQYRRK